MHQQLTPTMPMMVGRTLKYWVKPEFAGKRKVITQGRRNFATQHAIDLRGNETEAEIRRYATLGLDLCHFEGTEEGMAELARLLNAKQEHKQRMRRSLTKTELRVAPGFEHIAKPQTVPNSTEIWALQLIANAAGITVEELSDLRNATVEQIGAREDWKKIGKAFGLTGNFTPEKVHAKING